MCVSTVPCIWSTSVYELLCVQSASMYGLSFHTLVRMEFNAMPCINPLLYRLYLKTCTKSKERHVHFVLLLERECHNFSVGSLVLSMNG